MRSIRLFDASKTAAAAIFHVTDMEGSKTFFKVISRSHILNYHPEKGLDFNKSYQNPYFIYGGDVTDRGNHDLEITKLLVDFKIKYPRNVFLIAGNREITKNRFKIELDSHFIHQRLVHGKAPRWITPEQQTRPVDYVIQEMKEAGYTDTRADAIQAYVNSLSIETAQLICLRWMLEKTMGCPNTFRYRREELAKTSGEVNDVDVLNSFIRESSPTGITGQYLQLAQIGVVIPSTGVMAVHGGLTPANIGRLPNMKPEDKSIDDLRHWIDLYNAWYTQQIKNWASMQEFKITEPALTALDDISLPLLDKPKSVMVGDMLNKEKKFDDISTTVTDYLKRNNIQVILTGHQSCGDHPAILRTDNHLFIDGDTGYSVDTKSPDDTRGPTCHTLEIIATNDSAEVTIEATLSDKTSTKTQLTVTPTEILGDSCIGKLLPGNRLVQCRLSDDSYRVACIQSRNSAYTVLGKLEVEQLLEDKHNNDRRHTLGVSG